MWKNDTFFHAHYFDNVYMSEASIHIIKIMCMKKSVIITIMSLFFEVYTLFHMAK